MSGNNVDYDQPARRHWWWRGLLTAALLAATIAAAALIAFGRTSTSDGGTGQLSGAPAAELSITGADGTAMAIPTGRNMVVYFMSTTGCVACEEGAVKLQAVHETGEVDVLALEVVPDTPTDWMTGYQQTLGLSYPVAQDPDGIVAARYGISSLSVAILIDADGTLVEGPFDPAVDSDLAAALAPLGVDATTSVTAVREVLP